jgi:hypothetical protein
MGETAPVLVDRMGIIGTYNVLGLSPPVISAEPVPKEDTYIWRFAFFKIGAGIEIVGTSGLPTPISVRSLYLGSAATLEYSQIQLQVVESCTYFISKPASLFTPFFSK